MNQSNAQLAVRALRDHFLGGALDEDAVQTQLPLLLRLGALSKDDVAFVMHRSLDARRFKDTYMARFLQRVRGLAAAKRPLDARKREVHVPVMIASGDVQWVGVVRSGTKYDATVTVHLLPIGHGPSSTSMLRFVLWKEPPQSLKFACSFSAAIVRLLKRPFRGEGNVVAKVLRGVQAQRTLALFDKLRVQRHERTKSAWVEEWKAWWITTV
jgi:hypothetical protein